MLDQDTGNLSCSVRPAHQEGIPLSRALKKGKRNRGVSPDGSLISGKDNTMDFSSTLDSFKSGGLNHTSQNAYGADSHTADVAPSEPRSKRHYLDTIPENIVKLANNRYRPDNGDPYIVQVQKILTLPTVQGSIGVLKLAKALLAHLPGHMNIAHDFKRTGLNKFSISFPNFSQANSFVTAIWHIKTKVFESEIWVAFIPHYRITKQMIIRGIDDDFLSSEFILNHIRPPLEWRGHWSGPIDVTRLQKRIVDKENPLGFTMVNTNLYIATFNNIEIFPRATILSKSVFLSPFVQRVRRYSTCQRYGHTSKICKRVVY